MESVVQIIVPELSCLNQGSSDNLGTTISEGQANVEFISANNSPIVSANTTTFRGTSLRGVKDSLSALAAAAELDQQNHVNNIIGETKLITISSCKKMSPSVLSDISDKDDSNQIFRSCSYENKVLSYRPLPLAPFLSSSDPDVTFYNEVYHYLCSATFPEGSSEVYKRLIKKRASNYLINSKGELLFGIKSPRQVITCLNDQSRVLQTSHVDKDTGSSKGLWSI
ncbi:hypothetical protein Anas_01969 [Armadillidium nasatum]|uniref:Uncharacterized protein n=1 Tax=Armadillidium nasatum TaxID=96803 RepID=A0A5N5SRK0_9CRUS|nr:hypothetical protein Anas_01969 [Armadillidium nasatum]